MNTIEENIEKAKQPDYLYKYYTFNEFSLKVLINRKIWVSKFEQFNDPFEGLYKVVHYSAEFPKDDYYKHNFKHFNKILISKQYVVFDKLRRWLFKVLAFYKKIGIFCLSEDKDNILLWSYYSNCHTGFCLEFENSKRSIIEDKIRTRKVEYVLKNEFEISIANFSENQLKALDSLINTKNILWNHEAEWRILYDIGNKSYPFPGKLTKVIFGYKTTKENIKLVMNILKDTIKYEKMELDLDKYKLIPKIIEYK